MAAVKASVTTEAPQNFAAAVQRSGVTPAALGTGYILFFTYSAVLGVFPVLLSVAVERRQRLDPPSPGDPQR